MRPHGGTMLVAGLLLVLGPGMSTRAGPGRTAGPTRVEMTIRREPPMVSNGYTTYGAPSVSGSTICSRDVGPVPDVPGVVWTRPPEMPGWRCITLR